MSAADQGPAPMPTPTSPTGPGSSTTRPAPRRGWLIAALAAAVTLLLGSIVAVAGWTGGIGNPERSDRVGPGISEFRSGGGGGPGMMGEGRRSDRTERRADRLDHMRGWGNS